MFRLDVIFYPKVTTNSSLKTGEIMINRDYYLNQLIKYMWNGDIKVITGIRRSGKSVLLFDLFNEYLMKQGVKEEQILKYSLDQRRYHHFRNPIKLSNEIEGIVKNKNEKFYLFIDEVQLTLKVKETDVDEIEVTLFDMLNELKSYKNLDVYVTGSNSRMLSKDIVTEFRGRSSQVHVFPLSFEELFQYKKGDPKELLNEYMLYGGLPRIVTMEEQEKKKYLTHLLEEVYLKDVVERHDVEREDVLNDILDYLSSQISSLTNPTNIANALTSLKKEKVHSELVSSYIEHAIDAFLIFTVKRYDVKGKSYFKFPNKYYFTDLGLRNARLNFRQFDPGHMMENIIYNHLTMNGFSVDIGVVTDRRKGKNLQKEIDFVVNNGDKRVYIQSALLLDNESKLSDELDSLRLTNDFFRKIIVRNDISYNFTDDNGFLHCNLIDFLLNKIQIF